MLWFFAGINGTGKSTLAGSKELLADLQIRRVVNPDALAQKISKTGVDYALANLAAANITQGDVYYQAVSLTAEKCYAIETVLSSGKNDPVLDIAGQRGIPVGLVYVGVHSVEVTLSRIKTRVAAGLHDVPEERVRKRWAKTLQSLGRWAPRVDQLFVYSNNGGKRGPVLVAEKIGKQSPIEIYDRTEVPEIIAILEACGAR